VNFDETRIRLEAIHRVRTLRERWVAVPSSELRYFTSGGRRIFLKGQQGIFKPAGFEEALSVTTTVDSDYTHDAIEGSRVLYDYVSRSHDNESLKRCAEAELPLIYFLQCRKKPAPEYVVFAPVYVVGWDDEARRFLVDLSEQKPGDVVSKAPVARQLRLPVVRSSAREVSRRWAVTTVERRLYQARFRNAILSAYRDRCAVCGLHVRALLDAVPVAEANAEIDVRTGIALCATHHRAFDAGILRYDEEHKVRINLPGAAGEGEQTMLLAFDGKPLFLPADEALWPLAVS
jgi:putative restriction endonuclease